LMLTPPLATHAPLDTLSFTGGGAEYVFNREQPEFGDLGPLMGRAVQNLAANLGVPMYEPEHPILATLLGGALSHGSTDAGSSALAETAGFESARARDSSFLASGPRTRLVV